MEHVFIGAATNIIGIPLVVCVNVNSSNVHLDVYFRTIDIALNFSHDCAPAHLILHT